MADCVKDVEDPTSETLLPGSSLRWKAVRKGACLSLVWVTVGLIVAGERRSDCLVLRYYIPQPPCPT